MPTPIIIRTLVNGLAPVVNLSRNDLREGDTVTLDFIAAPASSYAWSIAYKPQNRNRVNSAAALVGDPFSAGPLTFVVDYEGSYLIRLVVDAGLPTQNEMYLRLRFLTKFGDLSLVAAGEKRENSSTPGLTSVIPVDASAEGWANDQNFNLNNLLAFIQRSATSGRIIYVDANRGLDNNNTPNDPTIAEDFADFSTIQDAITAAESNPDYNGGILPSSYQPMVIAVRPGFYREDLQFKPYIHIVGWPTPGSGAGNLPDSDRAVVVRCLNAGGPPAATHTANIPNPGEYCFVSGIVLENTGATTNALLRKVGQGDAYFLRCHFLQTGGGAPGQGAAVSAERGNLILQECLVSQQDTFNPGSLSFVAQAAPGNTTSLQATGTSFVGTSLGRIDLLRNGGTTAYFTRCSFEKTGLNPLSFGVQTWAADFYASDCDFQNTGAAVASILQANPDATGAAADLLLRLRNCILGTNTAPPGSYLGISADDTAVPGTASLFVGSCEFGTLTITPGVVLRALTLSSTIFYDDTLSGLGVQNVQDAIDSIVGGSAPTNAQYLVLALNGSLTQERSLALTADLSGVDSGPNANYTIGLASTGVVAGSYTRADITVDANGRLLAAASNPGTAAFSRSQAIASVGVPPFNIDEFEIINMNLSFLGGGSGAAQLYINQALAMAPGSVFVDILIGPPGGAASILTAPYDISALPATSLVSLPLAAGPFTYLPGNIIIFRTTYNVIPGAGDTLVMSVTGTP